MKDNLQIQINNAKEMKIPKMIAAGYASKLKTLRSGNWKLNEFDISVNLYMHLYRPNENKWPKEDGSDKFVDGFERIDERVENRIDQFCVYITLKKY